VKNSTPNLIAVFVFAFSAGTTLAAKDWGWFWLDTILAIINGIIVWRNL